MCYHTTSVFAFRVTIYRKEILKCQIFVNSVAKKYLKVESSAIAAALQSTTTNTELENLGPKSSVQRFPIRVKKLGVVSVENPYKLNLI